jgi:hypothetical protein
MRTGLRPAILAVAGFGCVGAAFVSACIVAPPAELPPAVASRPTILHGSVSPPPYLALTSWDGGTPFFVPVQLSDVNQSFVWDVFVDYDGDPLSRARVASEVQPDPAQLDAGVYPLTFMLDPTEAPAIDLSFCHTIEMFVGNENVQTQMGIAYHVFDSAGYDSVAWTWNPPGCYAPSPDAGAQATDASEDFLPIPPGQGEAGL